MKKYLVVTGGSRGIGKATIKSFMQDGWRAVNLSRTTCDIQSVTNIEVDLFASKNIQNMTEVLQKITADADQICLVHNAAYYRRDSVESLSMDNLLRAMEINVLSPVALNKILIPNMKPSSSIIYIGTTLAEKAVPGFASYTISKHALVGLMRVTGQDLINQKIHTCCICPGLVDTQLLRETMDEETIDFLIENKIAGKRLIDPDEIAEVILFCAKSNVINGITIHANTGHIAE